MFGRFQSKYASGTNGKTWQDFSAIFPFKKLIIWVIVSCQNSFCISQAHCSLLHTKSPSPFLLLLLWLPVAGTLTCWLIVTRWTLTVESALTMCLLDTAHIPPPTPSPFRLPRVPWGPWALFVQCQWEVGAQTGRWDHLYGSGEEAEWLKDLVCVRRMTKKGARRKED